MDGWIKLHRALQENWIWKDRPYSKGQAWVDLLMEANYTDVKKLVDGQVVTFKRGQVYKSQAEFADRWGWSRGKVRRFILALEMDGMCTINVTPRGTALTIENYEFYQGGDTANDTSNGHPTDIQRTSNGAQEKKEKKEKKEKNNKGEKNPLEGKSESFITAFKDFEEMRKLIKKPLSPRAITLTLNELNRLSSSEEIQILILEQSITNSWQGVFPLKNPPQQKPKEFDLSKLG